MSLHNIFIENLYNDIAYDCVSDALLTVTTTTTRLLDLLEEWAMSAGQHLSTRSRHDPEKAEDATLGRICDALLPWVLTIQVRLMLNKHEGPWEEVVKFCECIAFRLCAVHPPQLTWLDVTMSGDGHTVRATLSLVALYKHVLSRTELASAEVRAECSGSPKAEAAKSSPDTEAIIKLLEAQGHFDSFVVSTVSFRDHADGPSQLHLNEDFQPLLRGPAIDLVLHPVHKSLQSMDCVFNPRTE